MRGRTGRPRPQRIVLAADFGDVAGGCRLAAQSPDVLTRDHLTGTEAGRVLGKGDAAAGVGSLVCSIGWCNNIAWNVGPCSTYQLQQAIIAYEWNKLQSYKSIVPLIHLFWQLARNIRFTQQRCLHVVR